MFRCSRHFGWQGFYYCSRPLQEALGADRVVGVLMPNDVQSDIDDAKEVVVHLGIPYMIVNIGNAYRALTEAIVQGEGFSNVTGRTDLARDAEINTPPRLRMATLYAVGQKFATWCTCC